MRWINRLFQQPQHEAQVDAELRFHLEQQIADSVAAGVDRDEARRRALAQFGGVERAKEACREVHGMPFLETLGQDVRYAVRLLRKSPGFATVAILTLALGIGASTAVFSLVDAVLLKPLPFPHAEQIVFPWRLPKQGMNLGFDTNPWGRVEFLYLQQHAQAFGAMGAFLSGSFNLTGSGDPVRLDGLRASAGFFPSLGVRPALGRTFTDAEDRPGGEHEVILADSLWRAQFGADPGVLGRSIELNGEAYTVIGVMPRGFAFPQASEMPKVFTFAPRVQLWVPLALNRGSRIPNESDELAIIGRMKPGVTLAQAQADMDVMGKRLESARPNAAGWFRSRVTPLTRQAAGDTREPLLLLLAAVGLVLLIAASNVAGLLLTRSLARTRELTVRAALGAAGARLMRQVLTESLVLAAAGGAVGVGLAEGAIRAVQALAPAGIPRLGEAGLDFRVLAFALAVMVVTGLLFGLAPALGARRDNLAGALRDGGRRAGVAPSVRRMRNALLVAQIALALVVVISTGLLARTLVRLLQVDPGFQAAHALTFQLTLPGEQYPDQAHIVRVYQNVLERLRALPGVRAAGVTETVPMDGATESTTIRMSDHPATSSMDIPVANYTMVSPGYFAAVGTAIVRGRGFLDSDSASSRPVAVVNAALARKYWPGQDAIGKRIAPRGAAFPDETIVGVAADVKQLSLREAPPPEMYVPYTQKVWPPLLTMNVVLRGNGSADGLAARARDAVHAVAPELPVAGVRTLDGIVDDSLAPARFAIFLLSAFAGIALLLAAVGMYGVIAYNVAQRTPELGVRIALGARPGSLFQMVLAQGGRIAGWGVGLGLVAALGVSRLLRGFLYGVRETDPLTFAGVAILLALVALVACYLPARRAMRVDPMVALREE
ncbi:MAG TPA: ABC transporter permease [Terriglobales bacterium]|nr:ABC transporter permease [Terriglobales bacterium]